MIVTAKEFKKTSKEKIWIKGELEKFCKNNGMIMQEEFKFHLLRKWRFDFYIHQTEGFPAVAIEYEGLFSSKSRHTTATGFSKDTEKYNEAQIMGIKVLRYTALTYKNLISDLKRI